MLILALFASWLVPDALGSDRWDVREAAEARCRFVGVLAWPFLSPLTRSSDAETRLRAITLTRGYSLLLRDVRLVQRWLLAPVTDEQLNELATQSGERARVADALRRFGLLSYFDRSTCAANEVDWVTWYEMHGGEDSYEWPEATNTATAVELARRRWQERGTR